MEGIKKMDKKVTGIVGYLTWVGLIVAFCAGDKEGAKFHLNQSLVIWLAELVVIGIYRVTFYIPVVGWIIRLGVDVCLIVLLVFTVMGLIDAVKEEENPLPLIGGIQILK